MTALERAVLDVAALYEEQGVPYAFERYGIPYDEVAQVALGATAVPEHAACWLAGCLTGLAYASSTEGDED